LLNIDAGEPPPKKPEAAHKGEAHKEGAKTGAIPKDAASGGSNKRIVAGYAWTVIAHFPGLPKTQGKDPVKDTAKINAGQLHDHEHKSRAWHGKDPNKGLIPMPTIAMLKSFIMGNDDSIGKKWMNMHGKKQTLGDIKSEGKVLLVIKKGLKKHEDHDVPMVKGHTYHVDFNLAEGEAGADEEGNIVIT